MHTKIRQPTDLVTAEEIACWVYCPEQWRLQHGLGLPTTNRVPIAAGHRRHARLARSERLATVASVAGRAIAFIAVLVILLLAALGR
jgi:hypothetical protein